MLQLLQNRCKIASAIFVLVSFVSRKTRKKVNKVNICDYHTDLQAHFKPLLLIKSRWYHLNTTPALQYTSRYSMDASVRYMHPNTPLQILIIVTVCRRRFVVGFQLRRISLLKVISRLFLHYESLLARGDSRPQFWFIKKQLQYTLE